MGKYKMYLIVLLALILAGASLWFFNSYYEGETPLVKLSKDVGIIGRETAFNILCSDRKSGLKSIVATISQEGRKHILGSRNFSERGRNEESLQVTIDSRQLKLHDGQATIEISAVDHSLKKNEQYLSVNVTIDTTPPRIYLATPSNYINPGGSCFVIFSLSEKVTRSEIKVNDDRFPSYPVMVGDKNCFVSYFPLPIDISKNKVKIGIFAEDSAGNTSFSAIPFHIRKKKFRVDRMNISQSFLERKMPEFQQMHDSLKDASPIEVFSYVNEKTREENFNQIQSICKKSEPRQLWDGVFLRMKNAKNMATFGDKRTYYYNGKKISKSVHLGIDLASTKNASVEATNSGIVAFTGYLGIYGNSVIIDHGLGLFSFYAHLGTIDVKEADNVMKGQQIGRTDTSGLAGGDHLHFGIIVGGRFVDPKEWWDPHWIKDNIRRKMDTTF
jgi:hypothetical protein